MCGCFVQNEFLIGSKILILISRRDLLMAQTIWIDCICSSILHNVNIHRFCQMLNRMLLRHLTVLGPFSWVSGFSVWVQS